MNGIQEVSGSIPLISTNTNPWKPSVSKDFFALGEKRAQHRGKLLTTFSTTFDVQKRVDIRKIIYRVAAHL